MAIELNQSTFDPMLVMPRCVFKKGGRFFEKCKQTAENCNRNLPPLKHILASPTKGLKCTVSVLQPFTIDNFQMEHPVLKNIAHVWAISKLPAKVAESSQWLSIEKSTLNDEKSIMY